jgi:hemerythrin-like metal-binding protein
MILLSWNRACSVGVMAMDDQHAILMDTMNDLRIALANGSDRKQAGELLERLLEFTRMHFASEEQLMEQSGFPGLAEHRAEHTNFLAKMQDSAHRAQHCEDMQMRPLLCFLSDWYFEHIEGLDREYSPWLNERGIH